ncbi:MAG: hypothetical protein HEP71_19950 [Roseivirga sp.]|nr:hypothetical protein [Roseivirga sp.]
MRKITTTIILFSLLSFNYSLAQGVRLSQGEDIAISRSVKKELIKQLKNSISENYYDRAGVNELSQLLKKLEKSKDYAALEKSHELSRYLTMALRDFTKDPHFNVIYSLGMYKQARSFEQAPAGPVRTRGTADPENDPDKRKNFFMPKLEVLKGNIGYLKIDQMANIVNARTTVDAAMQFLTYTDAVILDLRGNRGGIGGFTPYMASYFFPAEKKLLFSRQFPAYDSASHFYTAEDLQAPRLVDQDLYVLIDGFTGSAARNLAYTLQQHGRAQLVGESTGVGSAGGHSAGLFALTDGFIATVPIAKVVHPVSKSNWSMVGVVPEHQSSSDNALKGAHTLSLTNLWQQAVGDQKTELKAFLDELSKTSDTVEKTTNELDLEVYTGAYELRKVLIDNNKLYLQRDGGPRLELKWLEKDLFQLMLPPNARSATVLPNVRFDRDEEMKITQLSFVKSDGTIESTAKKLE